MSAARGIGAPSARRRRRHPERLYDRMLDRGPDSLTDDELVEMLLLLASQEKSADRLANRLIDRFGSFAGVLAAPQPELAGVLGGAAPGAAAIKLVQVAALRMARAEVIDRPVLTNWDRLIAYLTATLARERVEQFHVLYLDAKNCLIRDEMQARGTVNHIPVYPREVVRRALELDATALILVHNHPSGDPRPSRADIAMTREVKAAAMVMGIAVHDHLILGHGDWISLRREGLL